MDKRMFKIGFIVGIFLITTIGIFGYYNADSILTDVTSKPIELSELNLIGSNGKKINLKSGKPIVINFWATWCAPCIAEFPQFEELNIKYAGKVDFVMISDEDIIKIEKFKIRKNYKLNVFKSEKTLDKYGLMARPATYFYNSNGKLINRISGGVTKDELEKEILKIIEN